MCCMYFFIHISNVIVTYGHYYYIVTVRMIRCQSNLESCYSPSCLKKNIKVPNKNKWNEIKNKIWLHSKILIFHKAFVYAQFFAYK